MLNFSLRLITTPFFMSDKQLWLSTTSLPEESQERKRFRAKHIPYNQLIRIPSSLLQVLQEQEPSYEGLSLRRVISLYFDPSSNHLIEEEDGNDVLTIPIDKIYDGARTGSYYLERKFKSFKESIEATTGSIDKGTLNKMGKGLIAQFNFLKVTPAMQRELRVSASSDVVYTTLVSQVVIKSDSLKVTLSPFLKRVKEQVENYSDHHLIEANSQDVIRFKSSTVLDFYYFIAKHQSFTNFVELKVTDLKEMFHCSQISDFFLFRSRYLDPVVNDEILKQTTCALTPVSVKGKTQLYELKRVGGSAYTSIKFKFKTNKELAEELLELKYPFIQHLRNTSLNESALIQIIARVKDGIIDERWVNFVINRCYDEFNNGKTKGKFKDIGPLVWTHIKDNDTRNDEYLFYPESCKLSQDIIGESTNSINQRIREQQKLFTLPSQSPTAAAGESEMALYLQKNGCSSHDIAYALKNLGNEGIQKKLRYKPKEETVAIHIHKVVLKDFKATFEDKLRQLIKECGFTSQKVSWLYHNLSQHESLLDNLFTRFDIDSNKFKLDAEWQSILTQELFTFLETPHY